MADTPEIQITAGMTIADVYDAYQRGGAVAFIRRNCEYDFEFYDTTDYHGERKPNFGVVVTAFGSRGNRLWDASTSAEWDERVIDVLFYARENAGGG